MKKSWIVGVLALSAIFATGAANAASANATAQIVTAIAISNTGDLSFGRIISAVGAGTVVLAPATDIRTPTGVTLASATGATAASFAVTGTGTDTYAITLPSAAIAITRTTGAEAMSVSTFTSFPSVANGGALTGGAQTLKVGATLNVGAGQLSGDYIGTFDVTVAYN
ncbi:MAG TPA: DUF4402 domain-containing protein [Patescibacteria group bacterium]|jgi:hypothetical protein|nr:DUF4402 domain-containing protein [Patescibacteria group bacterium]